jgi:hypothetical protein
MSRTMSRFAPPLFAAALLAALLASCGGSDLLNLDTQWSLKTVRNDSLPYTVPNASHDIVINSAIASLRSDNTYTIKFNGTSDGAAATVGSDAGDWSVTSATFTFHSTTLNRDYIAALDGSIFRGSVPGEIISSSDPFFDMVFSRGP